MKRNTFLRVWAAPLAMAVWMAAALSDPMASAAPPPKADAPAFTVSVSPDGKTLVLTPVPPMKFRVVGTGPNAANGFIPVLVNDIPDLLDWNLLVTFGGQPGPQPNPNPVPPPPPPPPPPPVPTVLFGIIAEESKERTPAQAVVILKVGGGKLEIADPWKDDGTRYDLGPVMKKYVDRAIELKIKPALFIVSPAGVVYFEGPLPAKPEDVEALIAKIRKGGRP